MTTALLIPCHNATRFLPLLRAQVDLLSPQFDEVLLADDGSIDATAAEAEALGFRILRLPKNLGPGGARNILAHSTNADWIHFHDVDDEIVPDYLAHTLPLALANCDAIIHFVDFISEQSRDLLIRWEFDPSTLTADPSATLLASPMPTTSSFLRRSSFLSAGGFDDSLRCYEDGDMHFRLALSGASITALPKVLERSLRHNEGQGSNQLYCQQCRLAYLTRYAASAPKRLHPTIAQQAEWTAIRLLRHGDKPAAKEAITLATSLGHRVPSISHPLLSLLLGFLPPTTALRLQDRWRMFLQSR